MKKITSFAKFGEGWDSDMYKIKKRKKNIGSTEKKKAVQERKRNPNYHVAQLRIILKSRKNMNTKYDLIKTMT